MAEQLNTTSEWLAYIQQLHPQTIDLGLDRIKHVASKLVCLDFTCPVITVAGTNGKGSCIATMARIAQSANLRVGCYTSPHLSRFNERISIRGNDVSDDALCAAFQQVEAARGEVELTYFEFTTLAALHLLQQANLDIVLLEVGLGGRLDAVNIIEPDIAVITSIGLDHQSYLGDTLEQIATEKAGVMRDAKPVIVGCQQAIKLLQPLAIQHHATLIANGLNYSVQQNNHEWSWQSAAGELIAELPLPTFPIENAAAAIAALMQLNDPRIQLQHYREGIGSVKIAARCQVLQQSPLTLLDVAHNPPAATWLRSQLKTSYPEVNQWHAIFACQHDKAIENIIAIMTDVIDAWHLIELATPMAMPLTKITNVFDCMHLAYETHTDPQAVVASLQAEIPPGDGVIIFGTFMLAELFVE